MGPLHVTVPQLLATVAGLSEMERLLVVLVDEMGNNRDVSGNIIEEDMNRVALYLQSLMFSWTPIRMR